MLVALIRIGLFLIPWLTVFFIPKEEFKKYTPVATFATLIVLAESVLSGPFKWWKVKGGPLQKALNDFSFIFGPFFVGTIWIFRFTYGKFWLYLLANILMDSFLTYPASWILQKLHVFKLVRFKPKHIFFTAMPYAILIYLYQMYISKPKHINDQSEISKPAN
ncbi:hypothetical protein [Neobacillus cucumis]|uniref:hypothetical protein n=1 Tax=Neobacillus cucumis TaxID=1740721 RepID=UPI001962FC71|nr:hypothetical protein [Neobacillus cucumis]MBM7651086.1 hypothetical protein [Neobacillus cucumis]